MAPTTSVSTPIPDGVSPDAVIKALHSHENYIKATCPQLISYELESGDPSNSAVYAVTDKKPIGQTTYKLTLTNQPDGIDALINAKPPVGTMTISSQWRVAGGQLKEDVEIDANMVMKKMAKGNVEKSHPDQHKTLIAQAQLT
jgi:hypothetical protein